MTQEFVVPTETLTRAGRAIENWVQGALAPVRNGSAFLTIREVAEKLGVSERRVRALIQAGRLKAQRAGWTWLVRPKDLAAVRTRRPGRPPRDRR